MVLSNITWRPGVRVESDYMKVLCACEERRKVRSKTFDGIANAMAEQWGKAGV